jgi:hypothetical protein
MTPVAQGSISERGEVHTQVRATQSRVSPRKSHHANIKASKTNQSYPTITLVKVSFAKNLPPFAYTDLVNFFTRASTDQKGKRSADVTPVHALQHLTRLFFFQPQHTTHNTPTDTNGKDCREYHCRSVHPNVARKPAQYRQHTPPSNPSRTKTQSPV